MELSQVWLPRVFSAWPVALQQCGLSRTLRPVQGAAYTQAPGGAALGRTFLVLGRLPVSLSQVC